MNLNYKSNAFTLIELMVAITIISILALWIMNIDFNKLSNRQKLEIYTNNIKTNIENTRNKALLWKAVLSWATLEIPNKWQIDFSKSWSWTIITKAISVDDNILKSDSFQMNWIYSMTSLKCWKYNDTVINYNDITLTWTIEFNWMNLKLSDSNTDCDSASKILLFNIKSINNSKTIKIDTLNWLIEIK
jgi:prepilin-type N-terminal cleavage/methylation domain-containing protein